MRLINRSIAFIILNIASWCWFISYDLVTITSLSIATYIKTMSSTDSCMLRHIKWTLVAMFINLSTLRLSLISSELMMMMIVIYEVLLLLL